MSNNGESPGIPVSRRSSGWIWYFAVVAVLAIIFTGVLIRFNLAQQLTLADLQAAEKLWSKRGPADYDMEYTKEGNVTGVFNVQVRDRRVIKAICDGRPQEERLLGYSSMPALFGFIEDFLKEDAKPGNRRVFTTGQFDPVDGHLIHYVRRVTGTMERIELSVRFHPLSQTPSPSTERKR
jgi:hypothetical protein